MSNPQVLEAIAASQRLLDRGDIDAALRVLEDHHSDVADLQRGSIAAIGVLLDGRDPNDAVSVLTPHLENPRALDLVGLAHYHAAITAGTHTLAEAAGECAAASRMEFDQDCWRAENALHIGVIQQRQGSYDIAEVYLRDAYGNGDRCPGVRVTAAKHLGLDSSARGDESGALMLLEESIDVARLNRLDAAIPHSLLALAELVQTSRPERAEKLIEEAVDIARSVQCRRPLAVALLARGRLEQHRADLDEARRLATLIDDHALLTRIESLG